VRNVAGRRALLLRPAISVAAMLVLGLAVGKRSTPVDDWFHRLRHTSVRRLLFFTDPWLMVVVLMFGIAVAVFLGRRRLGLVMAVSPLVGIAIVELVKPVIGRHSGSSLAYPSGHTTTLVIVVGMLVLLADAAWWAVLAAAIVSLLGALGQGVTYHYFTDTVGGLLLGSAVVGVAAAAAKLDRRQPACDPDHTAG
jgi:membrane-associated phospholipid phosphatase